MRSLPDEESRVRGEQQKRWGLVRQVRDEAERVSCGCAEGPTSWMKDHGARTHRADPRPPALSAENILALMDFTDQA